MVYPLVQEAILLQNFGSPKNQLLAALPDEDYQRILPHLEVVDLPLQKVLYHPGDSIEYVYFPRESIISLVTILEDGASVEVGIIGNEGVLGVEVFLGDPTAHHEMVVQSADSGIRMAAAPFKVEFERGGPLQRLLLRYTQTLFFQVSQGGACFRRHTIEERLARWLLMVSDRIGSNELPLTQEFIAQMLGTRRAGVTIAAGTLQRAGLIRYGRGRITIVDREHLEEACCECYRLIKEMTERSLPLERE
ncbi:MAG: Crp/Fnr family transcriptional regulator [Myxacorys chilensis ATA2-1-KO14]|nr:Crp/Fnr family transcriptional regulator [Myxacorys chilensis ATA2-1-KO14]